MKTILIQLEETSFGWKFSDDKTFCNVFYNSCDDYFKGRFKKRDIANMTVGELFEIMFSVDGRGYLRSFTEKLNIDRCLDRWKKNELQPEDSIANSLLNEEQIFRKYFTTEKVTYRNLQSMHECGIKSPFYSEDIDPDKITQDEDLDDLTSQINNN